jgi:hypothetical protein
MAMRELTVDDAINVANVAEACLPADADRDHRQLVAAAGRLVRHIATQREELERERARRYGLAQPAAHAEGHRLVDGHDAGGRRDVLNGRPVHAGQGLYLLTARGWLPVRYESTGNGAVLYLELPGTAREVVFAVPRDAALVWPDELTAHRARQ